MTHTFSPQAGGVVSADIAVPEHEREVQFYSHVLTTGAGPFWRADLMNSLGQPIIGLGQKIEEYAHLPLHWMPHFQVADVAGSVRRALEQGGTELLHSKDEDGQSQWAGLLDPNGAGLGIIPVVPADAMPQIDAAAPTGHIAWLDITVADAAATRDFYSRALGCSVVEVEMEDGPERYVDFHLVGADGQAVAGIRHARGVNANVPPVWMIHLPVGDLAMSLRRVAERGGKVLVETRGAGARAVIEDPIGARLALVQG